MMSERQIPSNPDWFFRFAVTTTLVSVVAVTLLAAVRIATLAPDTFDPANTEAEHWAAVGMIGFLGLVFALPIAIAIQLIGWPIFKVVQSLGGDPISAGAIVGCLPWIALFGWLAIVMNSVVWAAPTVLGAVIGAFVAKTMSRPSDSAKELQTESL